MVIENSLGGGDMLEKVVVFILVQVLVYLILSKSSNIFSKTCQMRSPSFKTARSVSIRRILAALSDMPAGGEPSPSSKDKNSPKTTLEDTTVHDHDHTS